MSPAYQPLSEQTIAWVQRALSVTVLDCSRLLGGLGSGMDRLTVRAGGDPFDVVLRRWSGDDEWSAGLVERESAGLTALAAHDLPTPLLLAADATGELAGVRSLLMSALPGEPLLAPTDVRDWVRQMARMLVHIHDVPAALEPTDPHGFNSDADRSWVDDPALCRDALAAAAAASFERQRAFMHGDYQHFNLLWRDERLSGVVDWTFVGCGSRGLDVGHCRLNLAVLISADAAERFRQCYEAEAGLRVDPEMDIRALLNFGPSWPEFIPHQVVGRAPIDGPGMAGRVTEVLRAAVGRLG